MRVAQRRGRTTTEPGRPAPLGRRRDLLASVGLTIALVAGTAYARSRAEDTPPPPCGPAMTAGAGACRPAPVLLGLLAERGGAADTARIDLSRTGSLAASCPAIRPVANVDRNDAEYLPEGAPGSYVVEVVGTVVNRSSEAVLLHQASVRIDLPAGGVHDITVPDLAGVSLLPGTAQPWAAATIAGGLKRATVLALQYEWEDPSLNQCPR